MAEHVLRVRDPGTCFAVAYQAAYYDPFERETGIRIARTDGGKEPTELIRDMVERQDYQWDVCLTSLSANRAAVAGPAWLEDIAGIPNAGNIPDAWRTEHFQGDDFYSVAVGYRHDAFPDAKPGGWVDFWDVEGFPGRRSLRDFPMDVLEAALLASGADPDTIYPLDLDAAFASLDVIRPHITHWWGPGNTTQFLLTDKCETPVDMMLISTLRALEADTLSAPGSGGVGIGWGGNIRTCQGWGILKGSPNADLGRVFLDFIATPERQAAACALVGTSPTIPDATALLPPDRRAVLPDAHVDGSVFSDPAYWSPRKVGIAERYAAWMAR